jgi:putative transposase
MNAAIDLRNHVGTVNACQALLISRATFYRHQSGGNKIQDVPEPRRIAPLALTGTEKETVLSALHSDRFADRSVYEVYATLLNEGIYYCSIRTMYRLLNQAHESVKERRRQVQRPHYTKPELLATEPNQVWSWDITKLKSALKWTYFYLYVIIDIFSRYVVGWMVAYREQTPLAKHLIEQCCIKQLIQAGQLTLHADRGSSMKSKGVAELLADLGVVKTHSRPHVSNDNPYSEAQFKTLKYSCEFPDRFGSIEDARSFCKDFFNWYNKEHCHSGIGLMTPEQVHYGLAQQIYEYRSDVLKSAFEKHPNRFKCKMPRPPEMPEAAWINKPDPKEDKN